MRKSLFSRLLNEENHILVSKLFKSNGLWSSNKHKVSTVNENSFHFVKVIGFNYNVDFARPSNMIKTKRLLEKPPSALWRRNLYTSVINKFKSQLLLPPITPQDKNKKCLVIDLDETLINSTEWDTGEADFFFQKEYEGINYKVFVHKRPFVDAYLRRMGELFECVLFTASLPEYANPIVDWLDPQGVFKSRLFRESCTLHQGIHVKDLSRLGRDLRKVIIIDNSSDAFMFHPSNAVQIKSWYAGFSNDSELLDLIPFFERLSKVDDVYSVLPILRHS